MKQTTDKKGRIKEHTIRVWRNFTHADEGGRGKGLRYERPVKVRRLQNGNAMVTEYDGDQWEVSAATGKPTAIGGKRLRTGVEPGTDASAVYEADEGEPQLYFGRGLTHLTWWYNYATGGVEAGLGLRCLFEPRLLEDRDVSYSIIVIACTTGKIFAAGRKFDRYFHGGHTDYVGARDITNPGAELSKKVEFADLCRQFEAILFESRRPLNVAVQ